jgi:mono/diheme cytochrome c family protein
MIMRSLRIIITSLAMIVLVSALAVLIPLLRGGFCARDEPSAIEAAIARRLRVLAIPGSARDAANPVTATADVLHEAREHFGDHCAMCHGADGSGKTAIGRGVFPKVPDLRKSDTQSLTDGELFFIIQNGVRYSGMPAWGGASSGHDHGSWELVHLIRHFPILGEAEIAEIDAAMPKGRHDHAHSNAEGHTDEHTTATHGEHEEHGDHHAMHDADHSDHHQHEGE